ncbi:ATPase inhibitor subunit zeta [Ensifer canadensis]|uniref:ATPase inhibitor subunit zeta n=1 Tax=Ensifer canadensis TaxID=555315 RepID=UPI0035E3D339
MQALIITLVEFPMAFAGVSMNSHHEDMFRMVRRNKLVGIWAAKRLWLLGESAKAYSDDLATATLDLEHSDVLSRIHSDVNVAGEVHSDNQVLHITSQCWLDEGNKKHAMRAAASDVALAQIARNFWSK